MSVSMNTLTVDKYWICKNKFLQLEIKEETSRETGKNWIGDYLQSSILAKQIYITLDGQLQV